MKPSENQKSFGIEYSEHALDILRAAVALIEAGQPFALVASLQIEGGSAREVGSLAVVSESGAMTGYMSNGCIDRDVIHQALQALETKTVRSVLYGKGSPFMDLKLPCGGSLGLMIDPQPDAGILRAALHELESRRAVTLSFSRSRGLLERGAALEADDALTILYRPKPRLVLSGRGAVFRATATLAAASGFEIGLVSPDQRDLDALAELEPAMTIRMTTSRESLTFPVDTHSAFLVLFHDHDWEPQVLAAAVKAKPFFIGAMGSQKTHKIRLLSLRALGLTEPELAGIKGPVGLVPSLKNASHIALSALSEVIASLPPLQSAVEEAEIGTTGPGRLSALSEET